MTTAFQPNAFQVNPLTFQPNAFQVNPIAFQPNAFQVNPLAFQISQIGTGRSGVIREWLMQEQEKALQADQEKKTPVVKVVATTVKKAVKRRRPIEVEEEVWEHRPLPLPHIYRGPVLPEDVLTGVLELPLPSPALLNASRATTEVVDLDSMRLAREQRKAWERQRRRKAAFLMLLAA